MEMIQSSLYSFDESSVWDPKVIREHLHIPGDQLKILSSIPGWSKDKDNVSNGRRDIILEDSQSSQKQLLSATVFHSNRGEQNIKVFEEHLQNHKVILQSIEIYKKKFTRSISLFNLDKVIENSAYTKSLKRVSSAPSLTELLYPSYPSSLHEGLKCKISAVVCSSEELPLQKSSKNCLIAEQKKNNLPKVSIGSMEVISQLPVTVCLVENKTNTDITEKCMLSAIHTTNSSVDPHTVSNMSVNDCLTIVPLKECILAKTDNSETNENTVNSCNGKDLTSIVDKTCIVTDKENINENDPKLMNISEIPSEVLKPSKLIQKGLATMVEVPASNNKENSNLQNTDKEVIECVKLHHLETGGLNANTASLESFKEIDKTVVSKVTVENEPVKEIIECGKELLEKRSNLAINIKSTEKSIDETESAKKIDTTCINTATVEKAIVEKKSDEIDNNIVAYSAVAENGIVASSGVEKKSMEMADATVKVSTEKAGAEKRKLEYKEKTNKKRKSNAEKQMQSGKRNIKRAGEIYYSDSNFKSLTNILKHFF